MGKRKDNDNDIKAIYETDRKVEIARRGWDEDTGDESLELLKELRNDVREGE
jgi:hypothetical protein